MNNEDFYSADFTNSLPPALKNDPDMMALAQTISAQLQTTAAEVRKNIIYARIAFVRNRDKDKESNVKHDATVLTEIGYIKANTDEIKAEQKEQRKTNTEFVTRLTDVEASAKQAHKRLDHIEKRMDQAE